MSNSRHLLLLVCTPAIALACASHSPLVRTPSAKAATSWSIDSELQAAKLRAEASTSNPYAPVRSTHAGMYSWQSETRAECAPQFAGQNLDAERPFQAGAARGMLAAVPE